MTFSGTTHHGNSAVIRLDLAGDLRGAAAEQLRLMLIDVIVAELPRLLLVDLGAVIGVSAAGVEALVSGYATAIEYGTSYRVVNAPDQLRHTMQTTGTLDVLADSDDTGALLLALLTLPAPGCSN